MRRRHLLSLSVAVVLAAGCAAGGASQQGAAPAAPRRSADLITRAELDEVLVPSMKEAIERLRPNWLRARGPTSIQQPGAGAPTVYLDDSRLGGLEVLSTVQPAEITEARRLNASEATQRFGMNNSGGAIVLKRRVGSGG